MNIVVAGASGYIGRALIPELLRRYPAALITALARGVQADNVKATPVIWKSCDLFSLDSLHKALPEKIDVAYYLVHSMHPTAHLDQGSFSDYDLILADNFARALKRSGVRQLIYLSGLIPDEINLSRHLQSRLEVEQVFAEHALPHTIFRAGLILGPAGSSFQILRKLVRRLPAMLCPAWTQTATTPVDLKTVTQALAEASGPEAGDLGKIYDLAGCTPLSYMDMMRETARQMGLRRTFVRVPFFSPTLSRLWVTLITQTPRALVYPLVESLAHEMVARPTHAWRGNGKISYRELFAALPERVEEVHPAQAFYPRRNVVRSVQRLTLPPGCNALWVRDEYARWLPDFLKPFVLVEVNETHLIFCLLRKRWKFLILKIARAESSSDFQNLAIEGGLLAAKGGAGTLEFREVLQRKFVLGAIHDYRPSLPWFIYQQSQARLHLLVMKAFGRHLKHYRGSLAAEMVRPQVENRPRLS